MTSWVSCAQSVRCIYGRFRFASGERVELGDVRLEFDLERFILEGLRQADEVRRAAAPHSG